MANLEHLDLLKQGVQAWNCWREEHPEIHPNLAGTNLNQANVSGVDFSHVFLMGVNFSFSNLQDANLSRSSLRGANLMATNLRGANLSRTNLWDVQFGNRNVGYADLSGADVSYTELGGLDFGHVNLSNAKLCGAELGGTNLSNANLNGTDFTGAVLAETAFGDRDLRVVKGLETIQHRSPSPLSINTIYLSKGAIPEIFLQGTGAPNAFLEYVRSLDNAPVEYSTCFISYSSKDQDFAKQLHADLQSKGVRCWFAPHDLKIGDKIRSRIDEAIYHQDKMLLLLSEHALASTWVEDEVEAAMEKEQRQQREVLFPVRLDESVIQTSQVWAAKLRRARHIGDFTNWIDPRAYQIAFNRLLRDLKKADREEIEDGEN